MSARRHTSSSVEAAPLSSLKPPLHIFHVDDNPDDHLLLKAAAEMAEVPFTWDVAECADTAIFYLRALLALEDKNPQMWPDLVLLDVSLPQGGGLKVLEFIRSIPALNSLRVVVLSGSNAPGVLEKAYALGANSVLLKPSAFRELVKLATSLHAAWSATRRLSPSVSPVVEANHLTVRHRR
jgi:CheY-like chemotaxis protein